MIEMKHLEEGHEMMRCSSCTGVVRWRTAKNCMEDPNGKFQDDSVQVLFFVQVSNSLSPSKF